MDSAAGRLIAKSMTHVNSMNYDITLRHDVPNYSWFWIAALLLLIPPVFLHASASRSFEVKRWMQSDYPPVTRGLDRWRRSNDAHCGYLIYGMLSAYRHHLG